MPEEDLETLRAEVGGLKDEDALIEEKKRLLAERKRLKEKNHPSLLKRFAKAVGKELKDAIK